MKQFIQFSKSTQYILASVIRMVWLLAVVIALIGAVIAAGLFAWWYPIDYLIEGKTYHKRYIAGLMDVAGYRDVYSVSVDVPDKSIRDFTTKCCAWVSVDDGQTYHPLRFHYEFDRKGWLSGAASLVPTKGCLRDSQKAFDPYFEWSGKSREELLAIYYSDKPQDDGSDQLPSSPATVATK